MFTEASGDLELGLKGVIQRTDACPLLPVV